MIRKSGNRFSEKIMFNQGVFLSPIGAIHYHMMIIIV